MSRLATLVRWDAKLQRRYGFYHASVFTLLLWVVVLRLLGLERESLERLLPALLALNLTMTTYYFVAGMVLFEKSEGTLEGLTVTPLHSGQYLLSKTLTLSLLGTAETLGILLLAYGLPPGSGLLSLALGSLLLSALFTLAGFLTVVRYDDIGDFLLPSILWTSVLMSPAIVMLGGWEVWPMYLNPIQAPTLLLRGTFLPLAGWQWLYALGVSALACAAGFVWARGAFYRYVILRERRRKA